MRDYSLSGILATITLVLFAGVQGCNRNDRDNSNERGAVASQSAASQVTFYSGGTEIDRWNIDKYTSGDGKLHFNQPVSTEPYVIGGTFVVEPKRPATGGASEEEIRAKARHKVTLYSDGVLVRTFYVQRFTSGDGKLYLYPELGSVATVISGTFVVEPISGEVTGADTATSTVALYSGARIVREWNTSRYTFGSGKMYLYVPGFREAVIISGNVIVKPK